MQVSVYIVGSSGRSILRASVCLVTQEAGSSSENGNWEEELETFRGRKKYEMVSRSGRQGTAARKH